MERKGYLADDELLREFRARFKSSRDHFREWRSEARDLYAFMAGNQWSDEDRELMLEQRKPIITFNLAGKFIDAVVGLQINNRQEIRYFPRENGDVGISDLATGAVKWNRDLADAEDEESDAFADLVLCGMGYIEHRLEDSTTPEGFIAQERRDPLEMYPDPSARKRNLSDARFIIRMVPFTRETYEERFGEYTGSPNGEEFILDDDQSPEFIRTPEDYDDDDDGGSFRNYIYVAQYQYWKLEEKYLVRSRFGIGEFTDEQWELLEAQLKAAGEQYEVREVMNRCYYQAFICGDRVHEHVKLPTSGFTIKAVTGKRDRNANAWYGIGRNIRDPNLWVNKFFSSILWTLSVNPKGGLLAEETAFTNPRHAESTWADPSKITFVADGALAEGKVQPKPPSAYPQGMDRLMEFSLRAMPEVSGINLELLGLSDRQQAGVVEAQRKQSAMAIIAWAFDSMRRYYKESGRIMLELIREYMADGRLIRIHGEAGAQYVPLMRDRLAGTYDIVVDEAPTSTNMRERVWAVIGQILPTLLQSGIPIPPDVLEYAPIPDDLAQKWKRSMQPDPQAQQAQQEQQQQAIELLVRQAMAEIRRSESVAALNEAKKAEIETKTPVETMKIAAEAGIAQAGGRT